MATTTRSDIPGYDVLRHLDDLRNPVFEVRRRPSEDIFAAKIVGHEYEPYLPSQRNKTARRIARVLAGSVGWVPVDDHGLTAGGAPYVVMPVYERGSLADCLGGEPLPWHDAVRWITAASLSIGNLHDEGVALGYLRASSILLSNDDEAHVALYGMASRRFDDGTFRFEAPEVVAGNRPSPAADTYSLAMILITVLIGRTPTFSEPLNDYIAQMKESCPDSVRAVIARALVADPAVRHRNGTEFAHSLRATLLHALDTEEGKQSAPAAESDVSPDVVDDRQPADADDPAPTTIFAGDPDSPGPLADLMILATATSPLPTSTPPTADTFTGETSDETISVPDSETTTGAASVVSDVDRTKSAVEGNPHAIAAEHALQELEDLTWTDPEPDNGSDEGGSVTARKSIGGFFGERNGERDSDSAATHSSLPEQSKEPGPASAANASTSTAHLVDAGADEAPFTTRPATDSVQPEPSPLSRLRSAAVGVESFWYANRRSMASVAATAAVIGIAGIAVALAYSSFQDGRVSVTVGAPVPTTEQIVVADLNNEISFVTEPPQTNTTTTTAPPRPKPTARATARATAPATASRTTAKATRSTTKATANNKPKEPTVDGDPPSEDPPATTQPPTTRQRRTQPPTTQPPTTRQRRTQPPTTQPPTTRRRRTEPPTTEPRTTTTAPQRRPGKGKGKGKR